MLGTEGAGGPPFRLWPATRATGSRISADPSLWILIDLGLGREVVPISTGPHWAIVAGPGNATQGAGAADWGPGGAPQLK